MNNELIITSGLIQRFWKKVNKTDSCWLWTAATDGKYGKIGIGAREDGNIRAHRLSWIIHFGPIPDGMNVLHDCPGGDNTLCVNPAHLWLGTYLENNQDMVEKGRHRGGCFRTGDGSPNHVLAESQVRQILSLDLGQRTIARMFGVSKTTIRDIKRRKTWRHVQ